MAVTKEDWKETGRDLGQAFKGLGKTLIKTVKGGVDKAEQWAESEDAPQKPEEAPSACVGTIEAPEKKSE